MKLDATSGGRIFEGVGALSAGASSKLLIDADFVAAFHLRSKSELGVETRYQGIWNETRFDSAWIKTLRRTLDRAGAKDVLIGAADQAQSDLKWTIVEEARKDPELDRAIYAFGDDYLGFQSTEAARKSGKPLSIRRIP